MNRYYVKVEGFGHISCAYYDALTSEDAVRQATEKAGVRWEVETANEFEGDDVADDVMPCGCCAGSCYCDGAEPRSDTELRAEFAELSEGDFR